MDEWINIKAKTMLTEMIPQFCLLDNFMSSPFFTVSNHAPKKNNVRYKLLINTLRDLFLTPLYFQDKQRAVKSGSKESEKNVKRQDFLVVGEYQTGFCTLSRSTFYV